MTAIRLLVALATAFWLAAGASATPRHGIAMQGEPALPPGFAHLPYANPEAPKGGTLRQAVTGSFDSVNPFSFKGQKALGLGSYVHESLMGRNWAEPFSLYALIAESIDVSDDRQSVTFKIRPEARFSDGVPITSADVAFSLDILRTKGLPRYKSLYSSLASIETPDPATVTFRQTEGNRELPLLLGLMPIVPKHFWQDRDFEATTLEPIVGSGPYVMAEIKPGESIVYEKNPDYWGRDLALAKGMWNFDAVRFDYYRDSNAAFEAFKKGLVDVRIEFDPGRWSTAYDFPAVAENKVIREKIEQRTPAPASGFAFNTRQPLFADARVRQALILAFDFEWANTNLFFDLYRRTNGYFSGSELSFANGPASAKELEILGAAAASLPKDILDGSHVPPRSDGSGRDRRNLRAAVALLEEAGWRIEDGSLVNAAGEPFAFTLAIQNPDQEKVALHYQRSLRQIGIDMQVRNVDSAQFNRMQTNFDYDMIPMTLFNSLSPGNEQKNCCASASRDNPGSRNYAGIADPAVDRAIEFLLQAQSREDFVAAARALDRLLVAGFYMVPFYDAGGQWVARWSQIGRPDRQPLAGFEATTLWRNPE